MTNNRTDESGMTRTSEQPKKPIKPRLCSICRQEYRPWRSIQPTCGDRACEHAYAMRTVEKAARKRNSAEKLQKQAERAAIKARKEKIKTRGEWAADAQKAFNAWIRARDIAAGYGCISCGTKADVQYAAGHFRTVAAAPNLRYSEDNVHLQCNMNCNSAKAGNLLLYRAELVKRIGLARVEALESDNEPRKYSIDGLKNIIKTYRAKLRELKGKE